MGRYRRLGDRALSSINSFINFVDRNDSRLLIGVLFFSTLTLLAVDQTHHRVQAQAVDHTDLVAAIKEQMVRTGVDPDTSECARWEVTRRVALLLASEGAGLIGKPSGNNCQGFAVDAVMYRDGTVVDILGLGREGPNSPHWMIQPTKRPPSDWRAPLPVADVVTLPTPVAGVGHEPAPQADLDQLASKLDQVLAQIEQLRQQEQADTEKVQSQIDQVVKNAEKNGPGLIRSLLPLGALGCLAK